MSGDNIVTETTEDGKVFSVTDIVNSITSDDNQLSEDALQFEENKDVTQSKGYVDNKNEGFDDEESGSFRFSNDIVPKLSGKATKIILMHSEDDFLVPYRHAVLYKELLPEAELVSFTDKNHFLVEELPELVDLIKNQ